MHIVNLDLLRASSRHNSDGQPKDPHADHRAEHLALLRTERRARWIAALRRLLQVLTHSKGAGPLPARAFPLGANTQTR